MDLGDLFKGMFEEAKESNTKTGPKLCDLKPEDMAIKKVVDDRSDEWNERIQEMMLERKEIQLRMDRWWAKVRKDYGIKVANITVITDDDGNMAIHERVKMDGSKDN